MDPDTLKFIANFTATKAVGWAAGALLGVGFLQPNQTTQFETIGVSIVLAALGYTWSWWNTRGKAAVLAEIAKAHKVAPQSASIATASNALVASVNDNKMTPIAGGAVKIASALLFGLIVLQAIPARAQTPAIPAQVQAIMTQITDALNGVINFGAQFGQTDLNLAIADAKAQGNTAAAACWQTIETLNLPPIPTGAGLAYFKQRYLDASSQYVAVNNNCNAVAPLFVKLYNQFVQLMTSQNL